MRHASARWEGDLQRGSGRFSAGPGIEGAYSFGSRFEEVPGSNPEALLGAALAACFSMALAAGLAKGGTPATSVETGADVTIERVDRGFAVTKVRLVTRGRVPGISQERFAELAKAASADCPISRVLQGNVALELDAKLEEIARAT